MLVYGHHDKIRQKFTVQQVGTRIMSLERLDTMEVHYRKGTRDPRAGEQLAVWKDGPNGDHYALAPLKEAAELKEHRRR